jgi:membrane-bound inhibitor of C-type lysozyme
MLLMAAMLPLAACAADGGAHESAWVCENGDGFAAREAPGADSAVLAIGGRQLVLPRQAAADGARFADDAYEFWDHGATATLADKAAGSRAECRKQ